MPISMAMEQEPHHGVHTMTNATSQDMMYLGLLMAPFVTMLVVVGVVMLRDALKPAKRERRVMRWMDRV